tara:strand:- start:159 stop:626 length:468 start_codon:yes stop_codon:yes gene_type:complete
LHGRGGGHVRSSLLLFVRIRIRSILVRIRWTIIFLFMTIIIFQILALSKLSLSHFSLSFSSSDGVVLRKFVVGVGVVVLPDRRHDLFSVFSLLHSLFLGRVKIDDKSKSKGDSRESDKKGQKKQKNKKLEKRDEFFLSHLFYSSLFKFVSSSEIR